MRRKKARQACQTIEKKMDGAIKACWAIEHDTPSNRELSMKKTCHDLHKTRARILAECRRQKERK